MICLQTSEEVLEWSINNVMKEGDEVGQPSLAWFPTVLLPVCVTGCSSLLTPPRLPRGCLCLQIHLLHIIPVPMPEVSSPSCLPVLVRLSGPQPACIPI